ncbi:MAG: hypothetical protein QOJ32_1165 [Frankiaceae bacterium]|nr:hypothetical protein [Frankiaceae bacterium]
MAMRPAHGFAPARRRPRRLSAATLTAALALPLLLGACGSHHATKPANRPTAAPAPPSLRAAPAAADDPNDGGDSTLPPLARRPVAPAAARAASKASVPTVTTTQAPPTGTSAAPAAPPGCALDGYAAPDPARPVVALTFDLAPDHRSVSGTEHVRFTPDRSVTELVFRLWPNGPEGYRKDASLRVGTATSPDALPFRTSSAGGRPGTQGTLLTIPLGRTAPAGEPIEADLAFTLTLPTATWDRYGTDGRTAFWGSGHPMLAWQRDVGWVRDNASPLPGETQDSEAAATTVAVTAPTGDTVLAPGAGDDPVPAEPGRTLWRFSADAVRDVAVVVGPLATESSTMTIAGKNVRIVAAVAPGLPAAPQNALNTGLLMAETRRALPVLAATFGPVPFGTIRVVGVPGIVASGLEYPGMAWVLPQPDAASARVVTTHELAHQWFYALVGNNQAEHPWLDEAFATYAESLVDDNAVAYETPLGLDRLDRSMAAFGTDYDLLQSVVYGTGPTALHAARAAVGSAAFDAAVRCYVRTNAWSVASPASVAAAFDELPAATAVLRKAGALP